MILAAIQLESPRARLMLVEQIGCKDAPAACNGRGANEAVNFVVKRSKTVENGNSTSTSFLVRVALGDVARLKHSATSEIDHLRCALAEEALMLVGLPQSADTGTRRRLEDALRLVRNADSVMRLRAMVRNEIDAQASKECPDAEDLLSAVELLASQTRAHYRRAECGGWTDENRALAREVLHVWNIQRAPHKWDTLNAFLELFGLAIETSGPDERAKWDPAKRGHFTHPLSKEWR